MRWGDGALLFAWQTLPCPPVFFLTNAPPTLAHADAFGYGKPISLEMWEDNIIPLLLAGKQSELHEKHKMPIMRELYMVHEDAPVPAVMDSDGPAGRGTV